MPVNIMRPWGVQRDGAMREFIVLPWEKLLVNEKIKQGTAGTGGAA